MVRVISKTATLALSYGLLTAEIAALPCSLSEEWRAVLSAEPLSNTPSAVMPPSAVSLFTPPFLSAQETNARHSDNASASVRNNKCFFFIDVSFIFIEHDTDKRVLRPLIRYFDQIITFKLFYPDGTAFKGSAIRDAGYVKVNTNLSVGRNYAPA